MITYRKARALLAPDDKVFIITNGCVEEERVVRVLKNSLLTQNGSLYFDNHGQDWFLTKLVAHEQCTKQKG